MGNNLRQFIGVNVGAVWGPLALCTALLVVGVSYGVVAADFRLWPSGWFQNAYKGLLVLMDGPEDDRPGGWMETPRSEQTGVTRHAHGRPFPGYTAFATENAPEVRLVDLEGAVRHRWRVSGDALKAELGFGSESRRRHASFDRFTVLPDGGLLAIVTVANTGGYGGGLVRLERNSRVRWAYRARVHHDFDVAPDGTIFLLTDEREVLPGEVSAHLAGPVLADYIDVLTAEGEPVERIRLFDCIENSAFRDYLQREELFGVEYDVTHANAIQLVTAAEWNAVPGNGHRHALVSMRNISMLALVDLDERRIVRLFAGPWRMQHDAEVLANGNLLLFDNWGGAGAGGYSRVLEVDPRSGGIVWRFPNGQGERLDSRFRASQQRLPNGNTLITESHGARILEVARDGAVVWEYRSPVRAGKGRQYVPVIQWAQRLAAPWLTEPPGPSASEPAPDR